MFNRLQKTTVVIHIPAYKPGGHFAILQDPFPLNAKQLHAIDHSLLRFESHWSWLQRGLCRHCQAPVVAFLALLPGVKVAIIPAQNYPAEAALPDVKAHIFYHRRQHDIDDDVPKISGFLLSELKAMQLIITGLWHR